MNWQFFEALAKSPKTRPGVRAVGLVLAIRAKRDDPTCNPSIRNICKYAAVGTQGACAAIRTLEALGLVEVERRRGRVNRYHLLTVSPSKTPGVLEPRTVQDDPKCFAQQNSSGKSVLPSKTQVFCPAKSERDSKGNDSPVQDEDVQEAGY